MAGRRKAVLTRYRINMPGKGELVAELYKQPKRGPVARRLRHGHRFQGTPVAGTNYIRTAKGMYAHRAFAKEV